MTSISGGCSDCPHRTRARCSTGPGRVWGGRLAPRSWSAGRATAPVSRGGPEVPAQAPRRQVLIAMGAAAVVAAAAATVASVIVFGSVVTGHHLVRGSASPARVAGTPPPRHDGAGAIGAL